jgi:hypothetical protein
MDRAIQHRLALLNGDLSMKTTTLLLAVSILAAYPAIADDSLRCGGKIVRTGMSIEEVRGYCGSPSSSEIEEQNVHSGNRIVGKTQIHIWRYARSSGQRTAVLEFDKDELQSIRYESK